jgi:hypothetical protein
MFVNQDLSWFYETSLSFDFLGLDNVYSHNYFSNELVLSCVSDKDWLLVF